ncbi:hypothetical protein [Novipirellula rosea]|uniref:hypothetical protein n=1 Tax=Novipirellula rosea TaxID=1031540 RepID=UPI0031EA80AA
MLTSNETLFDSPEDLWVESMRAATDRRSPTLSDLIRCPQTHINILASLSRHRTPHAYAFAGSTSLQLL